MRAGVWMAVYARAVSMRVRPSCTGHVSKISRRCGLLGRHPHCLQSHLAIAYLRLARKRRPRGRGAAANTSEQHAAGPRLLTSVARCQPR